MWVEKKSKWCRANFYMYWRVNYRAPKTKIFAKKNLKMPLTCLILKISKNGLHHWVPWIFLHIFRYLTRNFKIFENPLFPGDSIHKKWLLRQCHDFITGLYLQSTHLSGQRKSFQYYTLTHPSSQSISYK